MRTEKQLRQCKHFRLETFKTTVYIPYWYSFSNPSFSSRRLSIKKKSKKKMSEEAENIQSDEMRKKKKKTK